MFDKRSKPDVDKKTLEYLQRNTEFVKVLEDTIQQNPDATDEEITGSVCKKYNFDPKMDVPMEFHEYYIPLEDFGVTKTCKQFVLGRIHQLRPYYVRTDKYITLTLPDDVWSDRWTFTMAMNDLFIYCAATSKRNCKDKNYVPIRIVLDNRDIKYFEQTIDPWDPQQIRAMERKRTERRFDRKKAGLSPIDEMMPNKTVVLARELCQLNTILNLRTYQSVDFPTMFFIDYGPRNILENNKKFKRVFVS